MYRVSKDGMLAPYTNTPAGRTQDMELLYRVNGAVYVTQRSVLMDEGKIIDPESCISVLMPRERSTDIDTELDFVVAEASFRSQK
ncbi:MAG: Acylneuraminate cytidylyltransferase [Parcubacteria group bacterium GW2011_GWA2_50_10b]|nr:MAG: Acylneuraminate cytidylyltransferase [Parcubacteria group bacterium GW2011_GWA2_50_10b]